MATIPFRYYIFTLHIEKRRNNITGRQRENVLKKENTKREIMSKQNIGLVRNIYIEILNNSVNRV